ncbi:hypothetical protein, partial [Streptomyces rameus]
MPKPRTPSSGHHSRLPDAGPARAALLGYSVRLVRLVRVTLPRALGRHRPHARPTDPPRRRHRLRTVAAALALAAATSAALLALPSDAGTHSKSPWPPTGAGAGQVRRAPADA